MVLTKADLVAAVLENNTFSKHNAEQIVAGFFEEICNALERKEDVKLTGFGHFELHDKKERPGRNPKTGEVIPVKARRVVTFHASQKLKEKIELERK